MNSHDPATPSAADAAAALASVDKSGAALRRDVAAMRVAMLGLSAASLLCLLLVGLVSSPGAIVGGTVAVAAASVTLAVVGANARARAAHFTRRYLIAIAAWAVLYAAALFIGMFAAPQVAAFWIPAAIASTLPGIWFAIDGRRSQR